MAHAKFSPSSAHRWIPCPGSILLESKVPDTSSDYADEGTAAHELAERCLVNGTNAADYRGERIAVNAKTYEVSSEMVDNVQIYLDLIRSEPQDEAHYEWKSPVGYITGELKEDGKPATGTADCVLIHGGKLTIIDLKYGRGVQVDAVENQQLGLYALGIIDELSLTHKFDQVELVIVQPRKNHIDRWIAPLPWLGDLRDQIEQAVITEDKCKEGGLFLWPGEKQCRFCRAKAICPRLAETVLANVADDFVDLDAPLAPVVEAATQRTMDNTILGNLMGAIDLIEDWCKAIRARTETELLAGNEVPGYKLVQGKKGSRAWGDADEVEQVMKSMRLKVEEMYDLKLISPTTAEKLAKTGTIGPRQWPKLQAMITQAKGKPSVAHMSDKRPALVLTAAADDFEDMSDDKALAILTDDVHKLRQGDIGDLI